MSWDHLFLLANISVVPAWLALIFLPRGRWTQRLALGTSIGLAGLYLGLVVLSFVQGGGNENMLTLEGVRQAFLRDDVLLFAWVHYLVFDLFVGAWQVRDAQQEGISHRLLVPCLVVTLVLGPIGFLLYFGLRGVLQRRLWV